MIDSTPIVRARTPLKPVLVAIVVAFLMGASVAGYLAYKGWFGRAAQAPAEAGAEQAGLPSLFAEPAPTPTASDTARAAEAVAKVAETQGGIDQRLAAAEQRIANLDLQAQAAAGNAARAEALLIAFAARRTLERGDQLGYLGDQLRLRFADSKPNSVRTVLEFAKDPVTLDVLLARLDGLQPRLQSAGGPSLARLQQELSSLFVIRRETTPSPQPARRFDRARLFLESGRIDRAIAEVKMLPGSASATDWIADANRYDQAQKALDLIETAAVEDPKGIRDASGDAVQQLGPAAQRAAN